MKWLKKYELASLNSLAKGSHFDLQALYKTYLAEKRVDYQSFLKLYNRFKNEKKMEGFLKYFDLPCHLARAFYYSKELNLYNDKSLSILDLGSGTGYFPFATKFLGHECVALDRNDNILYNSMRSILDVDTTYQTIKPLSSIKFNEKKFDLITSFQILYDFHKKKMWKEEYWKYFIDMLMKKLLKPGGRIFLQMNTIQADDHIQYKKNVMTFKIMGGKRHKRDGEFIFINQ